MALRTAMKLEIDFSGTDEGRFGPVLEAFGAAIAEYVGQVRLRAPASIEKLLVKSLLMGKRVTIPVHFEPNPLPSNAVIEWQQPSAE